jgi:hypothetical protein
MRHADITILLIRIIIVLASIVACGIIISGRYIKFIHLSVPIGFSWTRGGSYQPEEVLEIDKSANKSAKADKFPFPKKIWQTGPSLEANAEVQPLIATWHKQNPNSRYELLSDNGAERYVKDNFTDQPDIMEVYFDVSDTILRANLFRLLIMSASEGLYANLDTECLIPAIDRVPEEFYDMAQIVVSVEVDLSHDDVSDEEKTNFQLCQWTLMAMPGSKRLWAIVDYIIARIRNVTKEKSIPLTELGYHITVPEVCPSKFQQVGGVLRDLAGADTSPHAYILPITGYVPDRTQSIHGSSLQKPLPVARLAVHCQNSIRAAVSSPHR